MKYLPVGIEINLGLYVNATVVTATGAEYIFTSIKSALKDESGSIWIEKTDGSFAEISSGYQYCEFSQAE